jgi:hypothetical protein
VIFIKDYLEKTSPTDPVETPCEEGSEKKKGKCSIVEFPDQTQPGECSREEIGKLVDKLMSMPESSGNTKDLLSGLSDVDEDPFLAVATRLLEEELS